MPLPCDQLATLRHDVRVVLDGVEEVSHDAGERLFDGHPRHPALQVHVKQPLEAAARHVVVKRHENYAVRTVLGAAKYSPNMNNLAKVIGKSQWVQYISK